MADSVGQIGLDLVVNQGQFHKQMSGIQGIAKKAGAALAAAFAVKKIVDFGKQCIELGSDLEEVQNVVDVTFPRMSRQVDEFAKQAAFSFGLSETMAKRFTGTFGAMAKAFGFSEKAAYDMSTTLTGLAGDVASFYNISQDEAYTKLKSVFTGETESLKDLGVVMTQSALDAYAMANGFGKTTQSMSEMEKVALRYQFVQDQLSTSAGDFARTSDSWANQVRILKLQFDSLKATIGQGLINVLTPVIKVINTIIGKLMSLANAFKSFTELITGKKGGGGSVSAASSGMDGVAASADKAGSAMGGAGSAAQKAAKDIATATTGIDELNILNPDSDSGSGGDGGADYAADDFDMGEIDTSTEEAESGMNALLDTLKKIKDLFMDGFWEGLGDTSVFDSIKEHIRGIRDSLVEIFTDPAVVGAAERFAGAFIYNLGKVAGAVVSIGATIADNLLGGIDIYLAQNKQRIKDFIVSMFDIGTEIANITGDFAQAAAVIFSAFRSDAAKQVTADIIGIFLDAKMGILELQGKFGRDILDVFTRPFIDNQDTIKTTIEEFLEPVASVTSTIKQLIDDSFDGLNSMYDERIKPMFDALASGLSSIMSVLLETWNSYIKPILDELADKLGAFARDYLQPLIDNAIDCIGKIANAITLLWTKILQPFIEWILETITPAIAPLVQAIIDAVIHVGEYLASFFDSLITIFGGIIDFLVGVFTGEWSLAWTGIKEILSGIWELIKAIVKAAVQTVVDIVKLAWETVKSVTIIVWEAIKGLLSVLWDWLVSLATAIFDAIKTAISNAWESLKQITEETWEKIKEALSLVWDFIKESAEKIFTGVTKAVSDAWSDLKEKTSEIWEGIWKTIKNVINNIIGGVENMVNRVVEGINTMINGLNGIMHNIPFMSGVSIPTMGTVSLPRLAQGGYVRANTPQLAMIGDNRHQGEVVAPEDKLQAMVDRAAAMASQNSGGMNDHYLELMVELLQKIIELIEQMDLTVTIDIRDIKKKLADLDRRSGYTVRTT